MSLDSVEGESALTAQYVTYASLTDMLTDTNRLGVFDPNGGFAGESIVGSGSDDYGGGGGSVPAPPTLALIALAGALLMGFTRRPRRVHSVGLSSLSAVPVFRRPD